MATITLEALPWVTNYLGGTDSRRILRTHEIDEGETVTAFIRRLVDEYPRFGEVALDPESGGLGEYLTVVLNDRLLEIYDDPDPVLKPGDRLTLVASFIGG